MGKKKWTPPIPSPINIAKRSISVPDFWMFDSPAGTVQMSFAYVQSVQHLDVSGPLRLHCGVNSQTCSRSSTSPMCWTQCTFAVQHMWQYTLWDCPVKNREPKGELPHHLVCQQPCGRPASPFGLGLSWKVPALLSKMTASQWAQRKYLWYMSRDILMYVCVFICIIETSTAYI